LLESLKPTVYKHLHEEMGHLGADRMVALAKEQFFLAKNETGNGKLCYPDVSLSKKEKNLTE